MILSKILYMILKDSLMIPKDSLMILSNFLL